MSNLSIEEKIKKFPVDCYSRCVGWMTPTKNWNLGKIAEWRDRVKFEIK